MNQPSEVNMELQERIIQHFHESLDLKARTVEAHAPMIEQAGTLIFESLINEGKVLSCGNGNSAALSQYFSSLLLNRYRHERPGLPAIALSANSAIMSGITSDIGFNDVYSKQVRALGHPQDVLLLLTSNERTNNLIQAIQSAHDREMKVIAITCALNQDISSLMLSDDIELSVDSDNPAHINEVQLQILHVLADLIEYQLFGGM